MIVYIIHMDMDYSHGSVESVWSARWAADLECEKLNGEKGKPIDVWFEVQEWTVDEK